MQGGQHTQLLKRAISMVGLQVDVGSCAPLSLLTVVAFEQPRATFFPFWAAAREADDPSEPVSEEVGIGCLLAAALLLPCRCALYACSPLSILLLLTLRACLPAFWPYSSL